jgi:hypothetical protein
VELHLHSHRWERRAPDWPAAAVAGLCAGAILMVLELLWSAMVTGTSPWATSQMIAALVMGPKALQEAGFGAGVVAVALVTHYLLGIVFAVVLAIIVAPFQFDSSAPAALLAGAVFGVLLYVFNFYAMVRFFPWFAEMRGATAVAAHLIFGVAAALIYWKLERASAIRAPHGQA